MVSNQMSGSLERSFYSPSGLGPEAFQRAHRQPQVAQARGEPAGRPIQKPSETQRHRDQGEAEDRPEQEEAEEGREAKLQNGLQLGKVTFLRKCLKIYFLNRVFLFFCD